MINQKKLNSVKFFPLLSNPRKFDDFKVIKNVSSSTSHKKICLYVITRICEKFFLEENFRYYKKSIFGGPNW